MPFNYVASTKDGKLVKGVSDFGGRNAVIQDLELRGLIAITVDEVKKSRTVRRGQSVFAVRSLSRVERALFTKHLSVMLKAGLTLLDSLRILEEQAATRRLKHMVRRVIQRVEGGQKFSDALAEYPKVFSLFYTNIVRAGEASGTLEQNLSHLSDQMAKEYQLRKRVQSAMLYPTIVFIAAMLLGFFFAAYVIPQVANLFTSLPGIKLPLVTRVLLAVARFVRRYTLWSFIGLLASSGGVVWFLRLRLLAPVTHRVVLVLPIVGSIVKSVNLARFSLVFGTLLRSGIPITSAVEITANVLGNIYYKKALASLVIQLQRGGMASEALAASPGLFPGIVTKMIYVGEQSGKLEDVLGYLAEFYDLEVETVTRNLSTALEPVLLIFIGLITLAIAYAILIPIYQFVSAIRRI